MKIGKPHPANCDARVKILRGCGSDVVVHCIALGCHALRPTLQFLDHINTSLSSLVKVLIRQTK